MKWIRDSVIGSGSKNRNVSGYELGVVTHACNPCAWEAESWCLPSSQTGQRIHSEFRTGGSQCESLSTAH